MVFRARPSLALVRSRRSPRPSGAGSGVAVHTRRHRTEVRRYFFRMEWFPIPSIAMISAE
jgi:hypothetical protein